MERFNTYKVTNQCRRKNFGTNFFQEYSVILGLILNFWYKLSVLNTSSYLKIFGWTSIR